MRACACADADCPAGHPGSQAAPGCLAASCGGSPPPIAHSHPPTWMRRHAAGSLLRDGRALHHELAKLQFGRDSVCPHNTMTHAGPRSGPSCDEGSRPTPRNLTAPPCRLPPRPPLQTHRACRRTGHANAGVIMHMRMQTCTCRRAHAVHAQALQAPQAHEHGPFRSPTQLGVNGELGKRPTEHCHATPRTPPRTPRPGRRPSVRCRSTNSGWQKPGAAALATRVFRVQVAFLTPT